MANSRDDEKGFIMSRAVRIWEDNFEVLNKITSKAERNALCFALISYGFSGEVPQDLKLNKNNLLLFEVLKNNFIAKNQGGAPIGNNNRCSTVEKNNSTVHQPLSENIKQKTENNNPSVSPQGENTQIDLEEAIAKAKRFTKPTIDEIETYCQERNKTIDAERFWNFYESKGWKVGKNPMKDWRAAVCNWAKDIKPAPVVQDDYVPRVDAEKVKQMASIAELTMKRMMANAQRKFGA